MNTQQHSNENFREFLDRLSREKDLTDIRQPVDIRHIATLVDQAQTALLFHNVIGYEIPVVSGIIRSRRRATKCSRKNNLAESAALNPTGDLTNAQFPMLNSHPKWMSDCEMFHRCKTRSQRRTNSLYSQQESFVLQAGSHTCGRFSFRMRIENWELNIGQILPSPHSAKLFFVRALLVSYSLAPLVN